MLPNMSPLKHWGKAIIRLLSDECFGQNHKKGQDYTTPTFAISAPLLSFKHLVVKLV